MRPPSLVFLSVALLLAGCCCLPRDPYVDCNSDFSKVVSTDYVGNVISEWVGVGKVCYDHVDRSYNFLAVEKTRDGRFPVNRRYAIGRKVKVIAPNVAVYPIDPPEWICRRYYSSEYVK